MDNQKHIAILLATYNGERYLREQLDSLFSQTFKDWTLYIHDDGSTDNTLEIVKEYQLSHNNIQILGYPSTGGAKNNFLSMLRHVDADYYFFCDQDDVWAKDKVEISLTTMQLEERAHPDKPVIVCCDLFVVDEKLHIISNSFFDYQNIHPEYLTTFNELGASNICPGCTMVINRRSKEAVVFPADKATMHDSWIILCTMRANGIVNCIRKSLVYYRQHGDNTLGARDASKITLAYKLRHLRNVIRLNWMTYRMLRALNYGSIMKFLYYKRLYVKRIAKAQRTNDKAIHIHHV